MIGGKEKVMKSLMVKNDRELRKLVKVYNKIYLKTRLGLKKIYTVATDGWAREYDRRRIIRYPLQIQVTGRL